MGYSVYFEGPLVVTHIPAGMTDAEQAQYFERIEREVLAPRKRHGMLVVAGQPTVWTPDQRKRHQDFARRNQSAIRELCVASAMCMPEVSVVVRFALSAAMMLAPGSPTRIFPDETKARRWLTEHINKAPRAAV